jgi:hypothetical protein
VRNLAPSPWWTAADAAELDVLVHELVRVGFLHREACSCCRAGYPPCPRLGEAIETVIEWRDGRVLRSKAEWLRGREDAAAPTRGGLF